MKLTEPLQGSKCFVGSHAGTANRFGGNYTQIAGAFLVLATQNPIEQEGTYPLPEAQVDRFMLKVVLDYPKKEEENLLFGTTFPQPDSQLPIR